MSRLPLVPLTTLCFSLLTAACIDGGLNQNEQRPGNQEDGTSLVFGDVAVDPSGRYFLSRSDDQLLYGDIETGRAHLLPGLAAPLRVAFSHGRELIYLTESRQPSAGDGLSGDHLVAYETVSEQLLWEREIDIEARYLLGRAEPVSLPRIQATEDDRLLIAAAYDSVEIIDVQSGETLERLEFDRQVVDFDVIPPAEAESPRMIITLEHAWIDPPVEGEPENPEDPPPEAEATPETELVLVDLDTFAQTSLLVPNCADELVVAPSGRRAFLAPTECAKDPVSVIDLEAEAFVRNLPGFGPVGIAPRGEVAIAFIDTENVDESLFLEGEAPPTGDERYHLMVIDAETLAFDTIALGDSLPRYALTADGEIVLIDASSWFVDGKLRILDVKDRALYPIDGPDVRLNNYVIAAESQRIFLIEDGLYDLSIAERLVKSVPLAFVPTHLNITPDDRYLVLREDPQSLWIYDVAAAAIARPVEIVGQSQEADG